MSVREELTLDALYFALLKYRAGGFKDESVSVGGLPPDLSAVLLAVENYLTKR